MATLTCLVVGRLLAGSWLNVGWAFPKTSSSSRPARAPSLSASGLLAQQDKMLWFTGAVQVFPYETLAAVSVTA